MPQVGSQPPSHSSPHSTSIPIYEDANAPAPNLAPYEPDVKEDIHCCKYDEDEFLEVVAPTLKRLQSKHTHPPTHSTTYTLEIILPGVS